MSSKFGPNSKPAANSDAYRNNPIWDKKKAKDNIVAWAHEDGEITESRMLADNWKRFGHKFTELTEPQFNEIQKMVANFVKSKF